MPQLPPSDVRVCPAIVVLALLGGVLLGGISSSPARAQAPMDSAGRTQSISGVVPSLAPVAEHRPRSEAGIGALMPWADRLWMVNYPAHKAPTGSGHGLFSVMEELTMRRHPKSVVGTYANRMIHAPTHQLLMGPYAIDTLGQVRVLDGLKDHRLAATLTHLEEPERAVYYLTMEGRLLEATVLPGEPPAVDTLFNLNDALALPDGATPHFKSGFTAQGRVIVANNTYHEPEATGRRRAGRLASWDGSGDWTILEPVSIFGRISLAADRSVRRRQIGACAPGCAAGRTGVRSSRPSRSIAYEIETAS